MWEDSHSSPPPVPSPELDLLGPPKGDCWAAGEDPEITPGPSAGVPCFPHRQAWPDLAQLAPDLSLSRNDTG